MWLLLSKSFLFLLYSTTSESMTDFGYDMFVTPINSMSEATNEMIFFIHKPYVP